MDANSIQRKELLKKIAEAYFEALKQKSFTAIPFSNEIIFRTPLAPGGAHNPITGKKNVFENVGVFHFGAKFLYGSKIETK